jgi:serine/threonine protein kinase
MSETGVILRPGEMIGPYMIEGLLAEAGLERVYVAAAADGGRVAVKVPRFEPGANAEFLRRFERQAVTAARVAHPHLVGVLDSGLLPSGIPYVVEEYVSGNSLHDLIRKQPLAIDAAVRICIDVASGLDALHAARIIHRSLTPNCIFLDEGLRAKVGGFALAKDRDASQLTQAGHAIGAAHYIAPEQIRGEDVTAATDVYALGCVLYEALTGVPPFAGQTGMKVLWAHLQTPPPDPRLLRPEIPTDLSWAIAPAMAKTQDKRPATATTFARIVQIAWEGARLRDIPAAAPRARLQGPGL